MRRAIVLLLLSLSFTPAGAQPAALNAESLWGLERIAPPVISPDGRFAVAALTRFNVAEDKGYTDLWRFATDGSEQRLLTSNSSSESNPIISPDGQWLAFVAQRDADKAPQLYLLPLSGGADARRLTSVPTGVSAPKWYGDSQRLAFISRVWPALGWDAMAERLKQRSESKMTARVWESTPVTYWDQWVDERQAHLYQVSLTDEKIVPLTIGLGLELPRSLADATSFDINPRSDQIAFVADSEASDNRINLDLYLIEPAAKTARLLSVDSPGADSAPLWSPNGRLLAFTQQRIRGFYGDTRRLVIYDAKGKLALHTPFPDWDRSADGLVWAGDSKALYAAVDDAARVRVYALPLNGQPRALTDGANVGALALSGGPKPVMVALRESFTEPPTLVRVDLRSGDTRVLGTRNQEAMAKLRWGTYDSVQYSGANDEPVQMWINYPPDFDPAKRYPILLLLHGGPHNAVTNTFQWRWNAQLFAARGYVVAWHNFHGSSGFGQAFADSINPQQDQLPYQDTIKAAEWLAAQPWADGDRMVAAGGSFGGYLASILLGRKHPFKALVAHAAVYNWYTQVGSDFGFSEPRFPDYFEEPSVFQAGSPHLAAGQFNTPTLVIHGQMDFRVPVNHGIELYHMLKRHQVPSKLIYYPNENHWVLKPQNSIFWYEQVNDWIDRYAKSAAP